MSAPGLLRATAGPDQASASCALEAARVLLRHVMHALLRLRESCCTMQCMRQSSADWEGGDRQTLAERLVGVLSACSEKPGTASTSPCLQPASLLAASGRLAANIGGSLDPHMMQNGRIPAGGMRQNPDCSTAPAVYLLPGRASATTHTHTRLVVTG